MLRNRTEIQSKYEVVLLEDLMPKDHLLRKIEAILDTDYIRECTREFYSKRGRPAIDPVILVKMELIAYLFGIRSDRRLVEEIRVNVAYRWFLGLTVTGPVPHFTTPGKNHTRRWKDTGIFDQLFDHVVLQAVKAGYIDGQTLFGDSSHLKANANKRYLAKEGTKGVTPEMIAKARERHLAARAAERELCDEAEDDILEAVNADRVARGLKPLLPAESQPEVDPDDVKVTASITDPEAAMLRRDGKPDGLHYLQHRVVDGRYNFVLDVLVTSAGVTDGRVFPVCLNRVDRFGFAVKQAGLDAGYNTRCTVPTPLSARSVPSYPSAHGPQSTKRSSSGTCMRIYGTRCERSSRQTKASTWRSDAVRQWSAASPTRKSCMACATRGTGGGSGYNTSA